MQRAAGRSITHLVDVRDALEKNCQMRYRAQRKSTIMPRPYGRKSYSVRIRESWTCVGAGGGFIFLASCAGDSGTTVDIDGGGGGGGIEMENDGAIALSARSLRRTQKLSEAAGDSTEV